MPLRSFLEVAPDSHFPLENLPFGVFKPRNGSCSVDQPGEDLRALKLL